MENNLTSLIETVQHNCHIADARHAGDYTLCVYLLKMREMYRWENGIGFNKLLTTDDVGDWLTTREGLWDDIEEQEYKSLQIGKRDKSDKETIFEPFDNDLINTLLDEHKLVYNAGLGIRCRPHFFIADLEERQEHDDYTVFISGKEYARDMAAPAAMAQGNTVFIRRESLRRVIWEILDDAMVAGLDNPLTRTMRFYDFESDSEKALDKMTEAEIKYVILHEIGEVKAGKLLDSALVKIGLKNNWNDMLTSLNRSHAEIMLRAIRDHLADSLTTLPELLSSENKTNSKTDNKKETNKINERKEASLHFYFGNMTAMRKHLAPGLVDAYKHWHEKGDMSHLQSILNKSKDHWLKVMDGVNALYKKSQNAEPIEEFIKSNKLS